MDNTIYIQWCDKKLKRFEQDSDKINYDIDNNETYQKICEYLAKIEFGEIEPDAELWLKIAFLIGVVRRVIDEKAEIG